MMRLSGPRTTMYNRLARFKNMQEEKRLAECSFKVFFWYICVRFQESVISQNDFSISETNQLHQYHISVWFTNWSYAML